MLFTDEPILTSALLESRLCFLLAAGLVSATPALSSTSDVDVETVDRAVGIGCDFDVVGDIGAATNSWLCNASTCQTSASSPKSFVRFSRVAMFSGCLNATNPSVSSHSGRPMTRGIENRPAWEDALVCEHRDSLCSHGGQWGVSSRFRITMDLQQKPIRQSRQRTSLVLENNIHAIRQLY